MKPCWEGCNSFGIPIIVHFGCMGAYVNLKPKIKVYNFIDILIMSQFGYMGGYVNLKPCVGGLYLIWHFNYDPLWLYGWLFQPKTYTKGLQFFDIPIMIHFGCMGVSLNFKPKLWVHNYVDIQLWSNMVTWVITWTWNHV